MGMHSPNLSARRRAAIEGEIETHLQRVELLLRRLDRADAPFEDLEDDDPAGDYLDKGEAEGEHGRGLHVVRPRYGLDQRLGPVNFREVERDYHAEAMGMVRTAGGKWAYAN